MHTGAAAWHPVISVYPGVTTRSSPVQLDVPCVCGPAAICACAIVASTSQVAHAKCQLTLLISWPEDPPGASPIAKKYTARSLPEILRTFAAEEPCAQHLHALRWPGGSPVPGVVMAMRGTAGRDGSWTARAAGCRSA